MTTTILVTGATDGIGKQTALDLAKLGMDVIVHGRNEARALAVKKELEAATSRTMPAVLLGDLSSMDAVRSIATALHARTPVLDGVVHNAGVFMTEHKLSADGFETTMAVNHFAPFLLTHLLLEPLARAPQGRVVFVSSKAHLNGNVDADDLEFKRSFEGYRVYAASKLCNVLTAREMARRLQATDITVNALHPGVVSTKLLKQGFGAMNAPDSLQQGAATSVWAATQPSLAKVSGQYFERCAPGRISRAAADDGLAKNLYEKTSKRLGIEAL